jgi:hypothetical protein
MLCDCLGLAMRLRAPSTLDSYAASVASTGSANSEQTYPALNLLLPCQSNQSNRFQIVERFSPIHF